MITLFEKTDRSPLVTFDSGELVIEGRSYMDDAAEFYRNLIANISGLSFAQLSVVVFLEYFNTSSSKCLLELFRYFEGMSKKGRQVKIVWKFTDGNQDLEEAGEDYRDLISGIPFETLCVDA